MLKSEPWGPGVSHERPWRYGAEDKPYEMQRRNSGDIEADGKVERETEVAMAASCETACCDAVEWEIDLTADRGDVPEAVSLTRGQVSDCWSTSDLIAVQSEELDWTVSGLVPTRGVTIFSGEGGIGKSFIALDMAMAVAGGGLFAQQFECETGPVLYLDLENDEGTIGRRLQQLAAGREMSVEDLPIFVPKRGHPGVELQQDTAEGRAWLWNAVQLHRPKLVIIDSLIAAHTGDENNNVLMRQLMSALDGVAREGDLGLVVVHHQRKRGVVNDAGQLMRGASDLRNAAVSHFAARRLQGHVIICEHDKCRPARPSEPFSVRLSDQKDGGLVVELVAVGSEAKTVESPGQIRASLVLQRLTEGPCRTAQLAALLEAPERTIRTTLRDLVSQGRIVRQRDGMYRVRS